MGSNASLPDHPQEHLSGAGGAQHSAPKSCRSRRLSRRLLSLDYVIEHPELEWLPTEEEKVFYCTGVGVPKNQLPKRIYTGRPGPRPVFPSEAPHCGWADDHVCLCRSGQRNLHRTPILGPDAPACLACHAGTGYQDSSDRNRNQSDADNRARAVLAGWARDNTGPTAGVTPEASRRQSCRKESTELSRALDTFDSKVLRRFGGFTRAGAHYGS